MKNLLYFVCVFLSLSSNKIFSQEIEWQRLHGIKGSYITAITQAQSGAIFVATPYGIWRSVDTLRSWVNVSTGLKDSLIYGMAATGDGGLLVSTYHGVYRSSDDGNKWSTVTPNASVKIYRYLYSHPSGTCFVGARKRLFRSTNYGRTWSAFADSIIELYNGTEIPYNRQCGVAAIGKNNRIIIGNYYSDDNGKTWKTTTVPSIRQTRTISTDYHSKIVLASEVWDGGQPLTYSVGLDLTTDNGVTWLYNLKKIEAENEQNKYRRSSLPYKIGEFMSQHASFHSVQFLDNDTMIVSAFGVGVWKCHVQYLSGVFDFTSIKNVTDSGIASRYPTCSFMLNDSTLLLGTYGSGLFVSHDRAEHWHSVELPVQSPIVTTFFNDSKRKRMLIGTVDGLYSSENNGLEWQRIDTGFNRPVISAITVTSKGTIIASTYSKAYRLENNSQKWTMVNDLSNFSQNVSQLFSKGDSVFASKTFLWLSTDDGKTFKSLPSSSAGAYTAWGGGNNLLAFNNKSNGLLCIGGEGVNRFSAGQWGELKNFQISYEDKFDGGPFGGKSTTFTTDAHFSNYTQSVFIALNYVITRYDWINNLIQKNDKENEWLYGEFCYGVTSDQKGRPFAATMNGIAFSEKADKKWVFLRQPSDLTFPAMLDVEIDDESYLYAASLFGGVYRSKNPITVLMAPELIVPDHKAMEVPLNSSFKWNAVKDAKTYYLQIAEDSLFASIVYQDSMTSATMYGFTNIKENSRYYWRVQSRLYGITSPWSETRTFSTIIVYPSVVLLREPAKGSQNRNTTLNLIWNLSTKTESYHIQVSEENTFGNTLINDSTLTSIEKKVENLEGGTEYFWRVRGKNKAGYGTWSDVWNFRTKGGINSIEEKEQKVFKVYVIGNELIIEGIPSITNNSLLTISDIMGKKVVSLEIAQGASSIICDIQTISNGYYIVSIESGLVNIAHGITILR